MLPVRIGGSADGEGARGWGSEGSGRVVEGRGCAGRGGVGSAPGVGVSSSLCRARSGGARVGAQAVGEGAAGGLVGGEGVRCAVRVAQGADEEGVQRLVVRVRRGQFLQVRYGLVGVAQAHRRLDTGSGRLKVQRVRAGCGGAVGEVREGGAAVQGEGLVQGVGGGLRVAVVEGRRALSYQALEDEQVDVVLGRRQAVAAGGEGDRVLAEGAAEAADQGLEGGGGVVRRGVRPDLVDESVGGGDAAGAQGQGGEQGPESGAGYGYGGAVVVVGLGDAQDSVPHRIIVAGGTGAALCFAGVAGGGARAGGVPGCFRPRRPFASRPQGLRPFDPAGGFAPWTPRSV